LLDELKIIPDLLKGKDIKIADRNWKSINKLIISNKEKTYWNNSVSKLLNLLNNNKINYVIINYLDVPLTNFRDIDILIENKFDRIKMDLLMNKNNYIICRRNLFPFDDDKITYINMETKLEVDVYPKLVWSWWKISYAPIGLISNNSIQKKIFNTVTYLPSPTCDIYITAVHSQVHSKITLAELAHIINLILKNNKNIKWDKILILSKIYGVEHTIYIYLLLSLIVLHNYNLDLTNIKFIINQLRKKPFSYIFSKHINKNNELDFPLKYPYLLRVLTVPHEHIKKIFNFTLINKINNL